MSQILPPYAAGPSHYQVERDDAWREIADLRRRLAAAQADKELAGAMALREAVNVVIGGCFLHEKSPEAKWAQQVSALIHAIAPAATLAKLVELERDAERWRELPAWIEKYQINYVLLLQDIDAARTK